MDKQQILEKLRKIIKGINANAKINENTALIGGSVLDSLELMNFITKVEEEFRVSISDQEISDKKLGIISNMVEFISLKITTN